MRLEYIGKIVTHTAAPMISFNPSSSIPLRTESLKLTCCKSQQPENEQLILKLTCQISTNKTVSRQHETVSSQQQLSPQEFHLILSSTYTYFSKRHL